MGQLSERINIIEQAFCLSEAVEHFVGHARRFFYTVMLSDYTCPKCNGILDMLKEGRCQCGQCHYEFDPTVAFQHCSVCGGGVVLKIRRYHCKQCGMEVNSRFVFDTLPFEAEYFKQKMIESRRRKRLQLENVRQMLAQSRSSEVVYDSGDLNSVPGLVEALNWLTNGIDEATLLELKNRFDLQKYEDHVIKSIGDRPTNLRDIPPIIEDLKRDLIWRFVAVIFLEHVRQVAVVQEQDMIWVAKYVDRERCNIFDEA